MIIDVLIRMIEPIAKRIMKLTEKPPPPKRQSAAITYHRTKDK